MGNFYSFGRCLVGRRIGDGAADINDRKSEL
jgi:hypothetical protein